MCSSVDRMTETSFSPIRDFSDINGKSNIGQQRRDESANRKEQNRTYKKWIWTSTNDCPVSILQFSVRKCVCPRYIIVKLFTLFDFRSSESVNIRSPSERECTYGFPAFLYTHTWADRRSARFTPPCMTREWGSRHLCLEIWNWRRFGPCRWCVRDTFGGFRWQIKYHRKNWRASWSEAIFGRKRYISQLTSDDVVYMKIKSTIRQSPIRALTRMA